MNYPLYRRDNSVILGLTSSEWDAYLEKYSTISNIKLTEIRDTINAAIFCKDTFESVAEELVIQQASQNKLGKHALLATPVFMLLSVGIQLKSKKPFSVYGEITSQRGFYHKRDYIYKTEFHNVENFGPEGGNLTLNGPSRSCLSNDVCYILESKNLSIKLYDHTHCVLVTDCVHLYHSKNEFEEVKDVKVDTTECSLIFKYVSIPMAIYGRLELEISNKLFLEEHAKLRNYVSVYGKVVATYENTFGNYNSEEIVLFEKNDDEYEEVVFGSGKNLFSSRRVWVAVPAYSLLHVRIDLFEYGTNQLILNEDVELETNFTYGVSKRFVDGEFFVKVVASWFAPFSLRESQDDDDSGQEEHEDGGGDGVQTSGILESSAPVKQQFPAFEVFSVLICYKDDNECTPLNIYGLLQLSLDLSLDSDHRRLDIFKKDKEEPLSLSGKGNTIPVSDGPRRYNSSYPLSVICDLKDTLDKLSIKGFQSPTHDRILPRDTQLCSIFRGDHGFAALHYAIFATSVQADLTVSYLENGLKCGRLPVFGNFCAQYNDFDYSSEYDKNCYKIVFFKRVGEKDSLQVRDDGFVPLSRSSFVGPPDSSFFFDVDLTIGSRQFILKSDIEISKPSVSIKMGDCEVQIDLKWREEE